MSYEKNYAQISRINDSVLGAAASEILETYLAGLSEFDLTKALGMTVYQVQNLRRMQHMTFREIAELCLALGLDVGISIRDPEGQEITFYPQENFGPNSSLPVNPKPAVEAVTASTTPPLVLDEGYYGGE